jgi:hypothetical protein
MTAQPVQNPDGTFTYTFDRGWGPTKPEIVPAPDAGTGSSTLLTILGIVLIFGLLALIFGDRPKATPIPRDTQRQELPIQNTPPEAGKPIS